MSGGAAVKDRHAEDRERAAWLAQCLGNSAHSPLGSEDLADILDVCEPAAARAGSVVFTRSDEVDRVFVLQTGKVALTRPGIDRTRMLQILNAGDVFGDLAVLLGRSAPVDAVVVEDAEFLTIEGDKLLWLISTRPRIALRWMVSIAGRLAAAQDRLADLLAGPLDFQLASLLLHTADSHGVIRVSQETLAQLLGARRPSVARSLANLARQGLLEKHYREIRIVDAARLRSLLE